MEDQGLTQDVSAEEQAEKLVPQSKMNEIIKQRLAEREDKVRREMEALYAQKASAGAPPSQSGGMQGQGNGEIEDRVFNRVLEKAKEMDLAEQRKAEEAQRLREQQEVEKAAQQLFVRLEEGKKRLPEFEEAMADFEISAFPTASILAGQHENAPEILMEFAKNPNKAMEIEALHQKSPAMAEKRLEKLAKSIQANADAIEGHVKTNPPLVRIKPSSSAGVDTGKMGLKDYKKASWLRG